jgi:hypothetical protein
MHLRIEGSPQHKGEAKTAWLHGSLRDSSWYDDRPRAATVHLHVFHPTSLCFPAVPCITAAVNCSIQMEMGVVSTLRPALIELVLKLRSLRFVSLIHFRVQNRHASLVFPDISARTASKKTTTDKISRQCHVMHAGCTNRSGHAWTAYCSSAPERHIRLHKQLLA